MSSQADCTQHPPISFLTAAAPERAPPLTEHQRQKYIMGIVQQLVPKGSQTLTAKTSTPTTRKRLAKTDRPTPAFAVGDTTLIHGSVRAMLQVLFPGTAEDTVEGPKGTEATRESIMHLSSLCLYLAALARPRRQDPRDADGEPNGDALETTSTRPRLRKALACTVEPFFLSELSLALSAAAAQAPTNAIASSMGAARKAQRMPSTPVSPWAKVDAFLVRHPATSFLRAVCTAKPSRTGGTPQKKAGAASVAVRHAPVLSRNARRRVPICAARGRRRRRAQSDSGEDSDSDSDTDHSEDSSDDESDTDSVHSDSDRARRAVTNHSTKSGKGQSQTPSRGTKASIAKTGAGNKSKAAEPTILELALSEARKAPAPAKKRVRR